MFSELDGQIFAGPRRGYRINTANRLWGQAGYQLREEFLALLQAHYGAELKQVDFQSAPERACREINRWVEKQTAGKITNLISPGGLNELTRLLLINAVYFKGDWTAKFQEKNTRGASFYRGMLNRVKVQMMHQQAGFQYAKVRGIQVLELPYGERALSMVVLLPKRVDGLARLEASLSVDNLNKWVSALSPQAVKVFLPKFRLMEEFALANALNAMGMPSAFSATNADFSGMTDQKPGLFVSEVIHKAFVEVNEEGTEAAAATAVTMMLHRSR